MLSPHNLSVNLDDFAKQRVDSNCETPGNMIRAPWFVLPSGAWY